MQSGYRVGLVRGKPIRLSLKTWAQDGMSAETTGPRYRMASSTWCVACHGGTLMAMGQRIQIKGFAIDKHGKLVRRPHRQSVSQRLREKRSKRVKVARKLTRV